MDEWDLPELLTAKEIAKRLNLKLPFVYQLVRQDRIPHVRFGRLVRFKIDDVRDWISKGGDKLPGIWRRTPRKPASK